MDKNIFKRRKAKAARIIRGLKKLFPYSRISLRYKNNWELMVAVQLSAQCTDKKVDEVTKKLFKKYRTLNDYVKASRRQFEKDIYQTGFYRNKARNILSSAKIVKTKYNSELPNTMDGMLTLPGVARKTANVVLHNAFGVVQGVAVDTHVRRLSKRFGITEHNDPVKIERDLMEILPKKEWSAFSYRVIEYGRKYCRAIKHDHQRCPLRRFDA